MSQIFLPVLLFLYNTIGLHSVGLAIIEISIISRIIFYPFIKNQTRYTFKMRELQPLIDELKKKHQDDKQAFAKAQMELFKEHGVNPAAGCLPSIVQIVILFGLLGALNSILKMGLNTHFLIWDMARPDVFIKNALKFGPISISVPGILVILSSLTQFLQMKIMMPPPPPVHKEDKPGEVKEKEDFAASLAQTQSSMTWMFPLMFLFLGTQWPSGLPLYWTVTSAFAIIQQYQISGWGSLGGTVSKLGIASSGPKSGTKVVIERKNGRKSK